HHQRYFRSLLVNPAIRLDLAKTVNFKQSLTRKKTSSQNGLEVFFYQIKQLPCGRMLSRFIKETLST
ncbi:MAG: hypothetical protein ACSLFC_06095, partial [Desulfuromonadales bacterium]